MEEIKDEEIKEEIIEDEVSGEDPEKQEVSEEPEREAEIVEDAIDDRFAKIEKAIEELSRRISLFVESGAVISDAAEDIAEDIEDDEFLIPADELSLKLGD